MNLPTLPGEAGPWLGDVLPAAAAAVGMGADLTANSAPALVFPEARSSVVILVDGLGAELLQGRKAYAPNLRQGLPDTVIARTCLPSTTAAALTSFSTGALPARTNMVGYSVVRRGTVMNLLNFAEGVDGADWQPVPTYYERLRSADLPVALITTPRFAGTGLTRAAFRGTDFYGYTGLSERLAQALRLATVSPSLTLVYWSAVDHAGHRYGPNSSQWLDELEHLDREVGLFLQRVPADTRVVLTADHGMVEVARRWDLADTPALARGVVQIAGEGRAVHVHAELGEAESVRRRWASFLGDQADVLAPPQYQLALGGGPGNQLVGDALVFLRGRDVVVDSRVQSASAVAQRGVHGSLTSAELDVPIMTLA